jgi:hypothetical protein
VDNQRMQSPTSLAACRSRSNLASGRPR